MEADLDGDGNINYEEFIIMLFKVSKIKIIVTNMFYCIIIKTKNLRTNINYLIQSHLLPDDGITLEGLMETRILTE